MPARGAAALVRVGAVAVIAALGLTGCGTTAKTIAANVADNTGACEQTAYPDTTDRWPSVLMPLDRVDSQDVVQTQVIAIVTVAKGAPPQEFRGTTVTSLAAPYLAQPTVFHVDRLVKGELSTCLADYVGLRTEMPNEPRAEIGQRFLFLGYEYLPIAVDGTLFFGRYGERRHVDAWQPTHHDLYDPVALCPDGPGPDDPKDCPRDNGHPTP